MKRTLFRLIQMTASSLSHLSEDCKLFEHNKNNFSLRIESIDWNITLALHSTDICMHTRTSWVGSSQVSTIKDSSTKVKDVCMIQTQWCSTDYLQCLGNTACEYKWHHLDLDAKRLKIQKSPVTVKRKKSWFSKCFYGCLSGCRAELVFDHKGCFFISQFIFKKSEASNFCS